MAEKELSSKHKGIYQQPPQGIIKALLQMIGCDKLLKMIGANQTASGYLKKLCDIGLLEAMTSGNENLLLIQN